MSRRRVERVHLVAEAVEPLEDRVELAVVESACASVAIGADLNQVRRASPATWRRRRAAARRRSRAPAPASTASTRRSAPRCARAIRRQRLGRVRVDADPAPGARRARGAPRSPRRSAAGRRARGPRRSARARRASRRRPPRPSGRAPRPPPRGPPGSASGSSGAMDGEATRRVGEEVPPERPRVAERVEVDGDGPHAREAAQRE